MGEIAASALISESAELPAQVRIGPYAVIGDRASIGEGTVLGAGCVLAEGVRIGAGCIIGNYVTIGAGASLADGVEIGDHTTVYPQVSLAEACFAGSNSSLGRMPRPAATSTVKVQPDLPPLRLGKNCTVGCGATLYAGTAYGDGAFVGDGAVVRERCVIGEKVIIGSGAIVENDTSIGALSKIQSGSYITAYMEISEQVFIAPMVTTTNDNFMGRTEKRFKHIKGPEIGRGARIGGGSILLPGVKVAPETFVAAGALVTKDTVEKRVVKGLPARETRAVPEEELLD